MYQYTVSPDYPMIGLLTHIQGDGESRFVRIDWNESSSPSLIESHSLGAGSATTLAGGSSSTPIATSAGVVEFEMNNNGTFDAVVRWDAKDISGEIRPIQVGTEDGYCFKIRLKALGTSPRIQATPLGRHNTRIGLQQGVVPICMYSPLRTTPHGSRFGLIWKISTRFAPMPIKRWELNLNPSLPMNLKLKNPIQKVNHRLQPKAPMASYSCLYWGSLSRNSHFCPTIGCPSPNPNRCSVFRHSWTVDGWFNLQFQHRR